MGVKNTLGDLNNHLFAQIERLSDEDLDGERLHFEIERANALGKVAQVVVANANTILSAARFQDERTSAKEELPRVLTGGGR